LIHILLHTQIVKAGTVGECMFFIASGSVCVTTSNGQELCHLEDGDYFGEIAFVLKNRKVRNRRKNLNYCQSSHKLIIFFPSFCLSIFSWHEFLLEFCPLKRITNVIAIEFCEIYILDYANLKKYAQINDTIMQKLTGSANKRMEVTLEAEEMFKKQLDERIRESVRESFGYNVN